MARCFAFHKRLSTHFCRPTHPSSGSARHGGIVLAAAVVEDRTLQVKLGLAATSGKLDLSEMELTEVPPEVFDIPDLVVGLSSPHSTHA